MSVRPMPKQPSVDERATASRITTLRKARGLSQTTVANALGVTFQQNQKYERGTNRISPDRLAKLATRSCPLAWCSFEVILPRFRGHL